MACLNTIGQNESLLYDRISEDNIHLNVGGDFLFWDMAGWMLNLRVFNILNDDYRGRGSRYQRWTTNI
jgi:hypothetical protein